MDQNQPPQPPQPPVTQSTPDKLSTPLTILSFCIPLAGAVIYFMKFFSVVATLTVFFWGQWPGMPVVATGTFFWLIIEVVFSKQLREEKKHRTELLEMAEREYESLINI